MAATTAKWTRMHKEACTRESGGLEIKRSTIIDAGNGLFATKPFKRNAIITEYGGSLVHEDVARAYPHERKSHVRRIPGSMFVYDGYEQANGNTVPIVVGDGMGYMSNTCVTDRSVINVRIVASQRTRQGLEPATLFLVAKRDIAIGEEIISPYNNTESRLLAAAAKSRTPPIVCAETVSASVRGHWAKRQRCALSALRDKVLSLPLPPPPPKPKPKRKWNDLPNVIWTMVASMFLLPQDICHSLLPLCKATGAKARDYVDAATDRHRHGLVDWKAIARRDMSPNFYRGIEFVNMHRYRVMIKLAITTLRRIGYNGRAIGWASWNNDGTLTLDDGRHGRDVIMPIKWARDFYSDIRWSTTETEFEAGIERVFHRHVQFV